MKRLWLPVALALGIGGVALPATAHAANSTCTVWIVEGSADAGGVDARLTRLKPFLEKPMFSEFHKFTLLEEKSLVLAENSSGQFALPTGRQGTLTLLGVVEKNGKRRLRVRLTLEDGDKKHLDTVFVVDEGGIVLHAGEKHKTGKIILGVSCAAPKP